MSKRKVTGWIKFGILVLILLMWILSAATLIETSIIRDDIGRVALVTDGTTTGEFYTEEFFPVIFPVLVSVSCFALVIGCVGCCGAITESQLLLGWFFFAVLISFCIELSAGIWRLVSHQLRYNESDIDQLKANIVEFGPHSSTNVWFKSAWQELHRKFNCCGVTSFHDWLEVDTLFLHTCCREEELRVGGCTPVLLGALPGCGKPLMEHLSSSPDMEVLPYLMTATGVVQVIALMLALKLWLVFCLAAPPPEQQARKIVSSCPAEYGRHFRMTPVDKEYNGIAAMRGAGDQLYGEHSQPILLIQGPVQSSDTHTKLEAALGQGGYFAVSQMPSEQHGGHQTGALPTDQCDLCTYFIQKTPMQECDCCVTGHSGAPLVGTAMRTNGVGASSDDGLFVLPNRISTLRKIDDRQGALSDVVTSEENIRESSVSSHMERMEV